MTVEITRNSDGSVTLTVGGWVGPDPERIERAAAAMYEYEFGPDEWRDTTFKSRGYWLRQAMNALAAYPVGPVLTLTADEWAEHETQIAAKTLNEAADELANGDYEDADGMSMWSGGVDLDTIKWLRARARGGFDD